MTVDPRAGRAFTARRAAIAAPHQLATTAGPAMLARGGSAVDAMVAANWFAAHQRFGRLPFADCLAPAIEYAEGGFPVSPGLARWLAASRDLLAQWPATAACFLRPESGPGNPGDPGPGAPLLGTTVPSAGDTTVSCAADADSTVAAVIQSIYCEWGSGSVAGDTGVLLQNRESFSWLDPTHPNRLQPLQRPHGARASHPPVQRAMEAACDPRSDGAAAGF